MKEDLSQIIARHEFLVVGGAGGVGKTTLSAALAVKGALEGRKVALLTIDPARRLGNTLGLRKLGDRLAPVSPKRLNATQRRRWGYLAAAMFDAKTTFDGVVRRYAPSEAIAELILGNLFYQELSQTLSGTHEYMALERIYELSHLGEFDLIVLDTPPSSALTDFLSAPEKLRNFLDRDVLKWFLRKEQRTGMGRGMEWAFSIFRKISGGSLLADLVLFLTHFQDLFEGLLQRSTEIERLFVDPSTAYLIATSSDHVPLREALRTASDLRKAIKPPEAFLLNRQIKDLDLSQLRRWNLKPDAKSYLQFVSECQESSLSALKKKFQDTAVIQIPLREKDPSSLLDLADLLG